MENDSYSTSKEAADVVGITPDDIGAPANNYVRKKELIATGKFDADSLAAYGDNDYVLLKDISHGSFQISLAINSDVTGRGTVQLNDGAPGDTASLNISAGVQVTAKCNLNNIGDKFDGWYNGLTKISSNTTYVFTVTGTTSLTAKIFYLDAAPATLSFDESGGDQAFQVLTNLDWSIS